MVASTVFGVKTTAIHNCRYSSWRVRFRIEYRVLKRVPSHIFYAMRFLHFRAAVHQHDRPNLFRLVTNSRIKTKVFKPSLKK
jgi:hypothetical protein